MDSLDDLHHFDDCDPAAGFVPESGPGELRNVEEEPALRDQNERPEAKGSFGGFKRPMSFLEKIKNKKVEDRVCQD